MPSPHAPAVSVVVSTWSPARAASLLDALASLRRQRRAPDEVIVVVDHDPRLLDWVRRSAPDVTAIANRGPRGLSGARNTGVRAARAPVLAFLDDDAVAAPDWLERLAAPYADGAVAGVGGAVLPRWRTRRPGWFPEEFAWVVGCSYRGLPEGRAEVRNLIGCNMSFRREAITEVGGFAGSLGRVGARPLGCEETDLCIRIAMRIPGARLVYEPAAAVWHDVPEERARWRYFRRRCFAEGRSKAEVARRVGRARGLASERSYAARTLPRGVGRALGHAGRRGDVVALGRGAAIVAGLAFTTAGYAAGAVGRPA